MRRIFGRAIVVIVVALAIAVVASCAQPVAAPERTASQESVMIHVASLKGPTTMGIVGMMADPDKYRIGPASFAVEGTADAITPKLVSGEVDIALIPANLAAVLYAKTNGGVQVASINTLNVLYVVSKGVTVTSLADLAGRTVYSTGKGTTPEAVMNTVLDGNGLTGSVHIEYLSEATEVAAKLAGASTGVAVLPQPYVTVVTSKDPSISVALDLGAEYEKVTGSPVVTGVTVVRTEFAKAYPGIVAGFLAASAESAGFTNASPAAAGELITAQGITPTAAIAEAAIPHCGIVSMSGPEARTALRNYLSTLAAANPALVGGSVPGDDFYWG